MGPGAGWRCRAELQPCIRHCVVRQPLLTYAGTSLGCLTQSKPRAYQWSQGGSKAIADTGMAVGWERGGGMDSQGEAVPHPEAQPDCVM